MNVVMRFLRQPFQLLLMGPAALAIAIGLLPFPLLYLERTFPKLATFLPVYAPEVFQPMLTVIATAAMTALSLAYSLTLVVFTLAAGSIGPRLLRRFVTDWVNQATAGTLAGTFLYTLIALSQLPATDDSRLTVSGALVLGAFSVLQLIYFVRHVAQSVSIDDEVAGIAASLTKALESHRDRYEALDDLPDDDAFDAEIDSERSGYVGEIDEAALTAIATENDIIIKLVEAPGQYVFEGATLARASGELDDDDMQRLRQAISIDAARHEGREIEFSIHLLVEIGLRALSPGVNDQYTAIAVSDAVSGAVDDILGEDSAPSGLTDEDGAPRVIVPGLSIKHLMAQAYSPLRRASVDSVLASQALARAFARLYASANGSDADQAVIVEHARLLLAGVDAAGHLDEDQESVAGFLPEALRDAASASEGDSDNLEAEAADATT